jgi:hypothetical protein
MRECVGAALPLECKGLHERMDARLDAVTNIESPHSMRIACDSIYPITRLTHPTGNRDRSNMFQAPHLQKSSFGKVSNQPRANPWEQDGGATLVARRLCPMWMADAHLQSAGTVLACRTRPFAGIHRVLVSRFCPYKGRRARGAGVRLLAVARRTTKTTFYLVARREIFDANRLAPLPLDCRG